MSDEAVFWTSFFEQKKSLEKLIEESREDSSFYLFLSISAFITTLGLILDNGIIVIGGMLVAPLLYPILSLSMGITTSNKDSITRSLSIILKATLTIFLISFISTFLFGGDVADQEILLLLNVSLPFFLVSFSAGIAAAYSWVKQNLSAALPGVAIAVALIPPISAAGIGLAYLDSNLVASSITLYIANLLGISLAGLIIFSLFGFSRLHREEDKLIQREKVDKLVHEQVKLEKTKEELEEVTGKIVEEKQKGENFG